MIMGSAGSGTSPVAKRRKMDMEMPVLSTTDDLMVCTTCGAQYEVTEEQGLKECRVCEVRRAQAGGVRSLVTC
jgi:hypothetical protein